MGTKINAQLQEHSAYVKSLYQLIDITLYRVTHIWYHSDLVFYLTKLGQQYKEALKVLHDFSTEVIKKKKERREYERKHKRRTHEDVKTHEDFGKRKTLFLDMLLDASEAEESGLTDLEMREEVNTFIFEGHDTTSSAISWAVYLLGLHPDIQEQVYKEQQQIFKDNLHRDVTMKDINSMKVLDRVLKETLRIYPSVPFFSRLLTDDITFGPYLIPAGTEVMTHIYTLHRDPKVFPDPEEFDPDRFLPDAVKKRNPYSYIPFSAGPRNCIGQKFATIEEKVVLSTIIRCFEIKSTERRENISITFDITTRSAGGIKIRLTPR